MRAYYNETDEYCCNWLANLMLEGLIPEGDIDQRSIRDVTARDLRGYAQCHFFAGMGGWPYALKLAGWPSDRQVWTGSCPCQPFSVAGKQKGFADDRHLWPAWQPLIAERRPLAVFGEQVARAPDWLNLVRRDLEGMDYALGVVPLEAASCGADHFRDRYFFVADRALQSERKQEYGQRPEPRPRPRPYVGGTGTGYDQTRSMAHGDGEHASDGRLQRGGQQRGASRNPENNPGALSDDDDDQRSQIALGEPGRQESDDDDGKSGYAGGDVEHGPIQGPLPAAHGRLREEEEGRGARHGEFIGSSAWGRSWTEDEFRAAGFTAAVANIGDRQYIECPDGKWRRLPPPRVRWLGNGIPARVSKLRAIGNAIDPRAATAFITAYMDVAGIASDFSLSST